MAKLVQSACIFRYVVEYKCSDCGERFPVKLDNRVTGSSYGAPYSVQQDFEKHVCGETADAEQLAERNRA